MKNKKTFIISIITTVIILYILFKFISFNDIVTSLNKVTFKYFFMGFILHLGAYIFRTLVFYSFFKEKKINFFYLLAIHFKQNFFVQIFPANLGEFSFPIMLRKKLPMEKSFSVLLIARLISLSLLLFLFIIAGSYLFNFHSMIKLKKNVILLISILTIFFIIVYSLFFKRKTIKKFLFTYKLITKIYNKIIKLYHSILSELLKLKNISFLITILLFSFLSLVCVSLFYIVILKSQGIEFNLLQAIFITSIGAAFLILPFKSIGGFGTTEGSLAIGLMLMGISKEDSINAGFVIHILALLNVIILFIIGQIMFFFKRIK